MTWNEPGKNEKKDPWTGKSPRGNDSPPNIDALIKQYFDHLSSFFNRRGSAQGQNPQSTYQSRWTPSVILGVLIFIWLLTGFYIVQPASMSVITRFGKYVKMVGPGLHWIPRLIESQQVVNEQKISSYTYDSQMLTKDENIVSVAIAVQYRIGNAKEYLFNVVNPQESLQQATASALRQVIGHANLDDVLTSGREKIRQQVQVLLASILKNYQTGIIVTDVTLQPAKAPEEVKEAFDDAIKAQEDEQRIVNQAEAYAMQVEPIAKGQAQRLITDAKAYKQQIVLRAQGDTARFLALVPQYQKSPTLVKTRLYYDTMETVLTNTSKIFLDMAQGNQMIYLPLDKLNQPFSMIPPTAATPPTVPVVAAATTEATPRGAQ